MQKFSRLFLVFSLFFVNAFASETHVSHQSNQSTMCLSAYLESPIHVGYVVFYYNDTPLGSISVYGTQTNVVTIELDNDIFKNQHNFEQSKQFLSIKNAGEIKTVTNFTYQSC